MSFLSNIKRDLYGQAVGTYACLVNTGLSDSVPRRVNVFYGGARSGHRGGPQVKVDLLQKTYPENIKYANLLYLLSGSLYLSPGAITRLKDKGLAVVSNQNGVFYPAWFPERWEAENKRMADALALADHVFYQSEFCKLCADRFLGTTARSSEILYNGVDTTFFIPSEQGVRQRFRFLITGNIGASTYYRLQNALEALRLARKQGLDIEMRFAGILSADLNARFAHEIGQASLQDYFFMAGPYNRHEAPQVYTSADAYLMTKHNDPCPNAVLEALAAGLPVLYSVSGGVPELVGDDAGVGLPVADSFTETHIPLPAQIADGMADIMANREFYASAARKRAVEKFDISLWIARHQAIFDRLIQSKGHI